MIGKFNPAHNPPNCPLRNGYLPVYFSFWLVLTELGVLNAWLVRFVVIKCNEGAHSVLKIIKTASLNFYFSIVYFSFWLVLTELGVLNTWLAIVRFLVIKFNEGAP